MGNLYERQKARLQDVQVRCCWPGDLDPEPEPEPSEAARSRSGLLLLLAAAEEDLGGLSAMMVLLLKQTHLQKEVADAGSWLGGSWSARVGFGRRVGRRLVAGSRDFSPENTVTVDLGAEYIVFEAGKLTRCADGGEQKGEGEKAEEDAVHGFGSQGLWVLRYGFMGCASIKADFSSITDPLAITCLAYHELLFVVQNSAALMVCGVRAERLLQLEKLLHFHVGAH